MRSTGEKKWMPMKRGAILERCRQRSDRQGRGVGAEDRVLADHVLRLGDHLFLDLAILEHRLDDEIAAFQRRIIGGRGDAGEHARRGRRRWRGLY